MDEAYFENFDSYGGGGEVHIGGTGKVETEELPVEPSHDVAVTYNRDEEEDGNNVGQSERFIFVIILLPLNPEPDPPVELAHIDIHIDRRYDDDVTSNEWYFRKIPADGITTYFEDTGLVLGESSIYKYHIYTRNRQSGLSGKIGKVITFELDDRYDDDLGVLGHINKTFPEPPPQQKEYADLLEEVKQKTEIFRESARTAIDGFAVPPQMVGYETMPQEFASDTDNLVLEYYSKWDVAKKVTDSFSISLKYPEWDGPKIGQGCRIRWDELANALPDFLLGNLFVTQIQYTYSLTDGWTADYQLNPTAAFQIFTNTTAYELLFDEKITAKTYHINTAQGDG